MLDRTHSHHPDPETRKSGADDTFTPADREVQATLHRMISSSEFRASPHLAAFLKFSVERSLAGEGQSIKAYTIATSVLGRPPTFDPQADPIVRVEATRLRRAIERYYLHEGADDPVRIDIPRGRYIAFFSYRSASLPHPAEDGRSDHEDADDLGNIIAETALSRARVSVATMWGNLNRGERRSIGIFALALVGAMMTWTLIPSLQADHEHVEQALILHPVTTVSPMNRAFDSTGATGAAAAQNDRAMFAMLQLMPLAIGSAHPNARELAQRVIGKIASRASDFEGIPVLDPDMLGNQKPETDDLYSLVGRVGPGPVDESQTEVSFRLLHVETGEIVWTRAYPVDLDQGSIGQTVQNVTNSVIASLSGLYGAIRVDDARRHLDDDRSATPLQICLADSDLALRTEDPKLIAQAISCLSDFAVKKPAEALIFKHLSGLRVVLGALSEPPNSPMWRQSLSDAIADLETALKLQPDDPVALETLIKLQSARAKAS